VNILLDRLPEEVEIRGRLYPIETDFRAGIRFELMAQAGEQDLRKLLAPWFETVGYPYNAQDALEAALWFYKCGTETDTTEDEKADTGEHRATKQGYAFDIDADAIYTSFYQAYNIDLSTVYLHWWAFRKLLMGLPEESEFMKRIYYRTCDLKDLPKKEKQRIAKIRKKIEIKKSGEKMTLAERDAQMRDYVKRRLENAFKG